MLILAILWQLMMPFTTIAEGDLTGVDGPREVVVRSDEEWALLWDQHGADAPRPPVDFARQTVVGVFLGSRPSAGFKVEVTAVRRDGDDVTVEYIERRPGTDLMAATMITMPFQLVRVERLDGPIRFVRSDARRP